MGGRGEAEENGREEEAMKGCRFEDAANVGQVFEYPISACRGRPKGWCILECFRGYRVNSGRIPILTRSVALWKHGLSRLDWFRVSILPGRSFGDQYIHVTATILLSFSIRILVEV